MKSQNLVRRLELFFCGCGALHRQSEGSKVSTKRTFEAAAGYAGQKVAVHNFASATNPGGGVTRGSSAQENVCVGVPACISA